MNLELIVILALAIISIFTLFISFVFFRKNKKLLDEKNILESLVIKNSASNRLVDSLESFLEKKDNAEKKLCDSVRLVSSASTVIYSEMNKKDGSFKPVFYSSSEDVNIDELYLQVLKYMNLQMDVLQHKLLLVLNHNYQNFCKYFLNK